MMKKMIFLNYAMCSKGIDEIVKIFFLFHFRSCAPTLSYKYQTARIHNISFRLNFKSFTS